MMTRRHGLWVMTLATMLGCWAEAAWAQPFPGGLPQCRKQLSACRADAQALPATGQTICWNSAGVVISCTGTGQDGDIQAGAALRYTDNGDGTITDNNTKLVWEKKSEDDGSIHDKNTNYTWADAFAVHIAGLNAGPGFAGHTDWRLPNVKELQSIVDYQNSDPSVSSAFNAGCVVVGSCTVLTCSCTAEAGYWSSTTFAFNPTNAWFVVFSNADVANTGGVALKSVAIRVRAVRGGL